MTAELLVLHTIAIRQKWCMLLITFTNVRVCINHQTVQSMCVCKFRNQRKSAENVQTSHAVTQLTSAVRVSQLTLYNGHIKTAPQRTIIQQYGDWYTGR